MNSDGSDPRVIDRAELEKFAAQRRLPEAVLAQLRARAKNEINTAAVPTLKRVAMPVEKSTSSTSTSTASRDSAPHPLNRSQSAIVLGSAPLSNATTPVAIPRLSITTSEETHTGSSPVSPKPAQQSAAPSAKPASKPKGIAPLELAAINPVHRMPFNLESHTQQGADEFHAEENQDRHCYGYDHARRLAWLGISDGHCGSGAADFIALNIVRLVSSCLPKGPPPSVEELIRGITKGVQKTEEAFKKVQDGSGACLLLACLWEETLVVANVGDSRAVICSYKGGGAKQGTLLTNDHNASNPVEAKLARFRFLRNQGLLKNVTDPDAISEEELIRLTKEMMEGDDIIVKGRLFSSECTRTIGDFGVKKACFNVITWEPEFTVCRLTDADAQLILGCDGVWRTIDAQRAVDIVMKAVEAGEPPAQSLVKQAVAEGSGDDQTCLVMDLINYRSCLNSTTDLATKIFKGLSVFDNNSAQALASSAHRTFSAKLARLHKSGSLGAGQSVAGVFEQQAMKTQTMASSVHRESRGKFDRAAAPAPYAGLSLFEQKPKAAPSSNPVPRRLAQSSMGVPTEPSNGQHQSLSKSSDDNYTRTHSRNLSAGAATSMKIEPASASVAMQITPPTPPHPSASSAPALSVLSRSHSSPQMAEAESRSPSSSPLHPSSSALFVLTSCRPEDAQAQLSALRISPPSLPACQLFSVAADAASVGLVVFSPVCYGLVADAATTARITLLLLPGHKFAAAEVFRAAALHIFSVNACLHRLECCVDAASLGDCQALAVAGWRREGTLRGVLPADAGVKDGALYSLLRTEM